MNSFVLSGEYLTEFQLEDTKSYVTKAIVLLVDNARLGDKSWEQNLLGKSMKNWVCEAVKEFECKFVEIKEKQNPLEVVKPFIGGEDYTIVLFSDTPLVQENCIFDALDYATTKKLDFCKLPRGFILNSKSFKAGKQEYTAEPNFIDKSQFLAVFDQKTLSVACQILKTRIIEKHLKNKVFFDDASSVYIDATVEIAPMTRIGVNNVLRGHSRIEQGVVLYDNNVIVDSVVKQGSSVVCSYLENSFVDKDTKVGPFAKIVKKDKKGEGEK